MGGGGNLVVLDLSGSNVEGTLEGLNLNNMDVLNISNCKVSFDGFDNQSQSLASLTIGDFNKDFNLNDICPYLTSLTIIGMTDFHLWDEDIPDTVNEICIKDYETVNIEDVGGGILTSSMELCEYEGNVFDICFDDFDWSEEYYLKKLSLKNTSVDGTIEVLPNIEHLELSNNGKDEEFYGEQSTLKLGEGFFENADSLKTLILGDDMSIKLETITNNSRLKIVKLQNASGGIGSLSELDLLQELTLSGTVSGDIESLNRNTSLKKIEIDSQGVTGDISTLSGLSLIDSISLKNTTVTGNLAKLPAYIDKFVSDGVSIFDWLGDRETIVSFENVNFGNSLDNMLNSMCNSSVPEYNPSRLIDVKGNRTSASDGAVEKLQKLGYTVKITQI